MSIMNDIKRSMAALTARPTLGEEPPTVAAAKAMTERYRMSDLLPFRGWDPDLNMVAMDNGKDLSMGFGIMLAPAIIGGTSLEEQLEAIICKLPPNSVMQCGVLLNDDVYREIDSWLEARENLNKNYPLLKEMARRRAAFLKECARERSLLPTERLHTRMAKCMMFFRIPFKGDLTDKSAVADYIRNTQELRTSIFDALSSNNFFPRQMDGATHRRLMMQLLNPQFYVETLDQQHDGYKHFPKGLIRKGGSVRVREEDGFLLFEGGERDTAAVTITVDAFPDEVALPRTRELFGDLLSRTDNIPDRCWLWTVVHTPDRDDARTSQQLKLANITRMTLSDSQWFRSMNADLFRRRDETNDVLRETQQRRTLVRATSGITLFCDPERTGRAVENVTAIWRKAGYESSAETHIAVPIFVASLPYCYDWRLDYDNKGLQRLDMMTSFQAACLLPVAFDWAGHALYKGGPTFVSRRGQLGSIDFLQSDTNYNVSVVAASGSGKSFSASEFITDFLSRGGFARIIDAGRSYLPLATLIGGENIEFNVRAPRSLNPLWGIKDELELKEKLASLREILLLMAFPSGAQTDWQASRLELAITTCWAEHRDKLEFSHIGDWLRTQNDPRVADRCHDMADQLATYTHGATSAWFNGPREVQIDNDFTILELDGLNQNKPLRAVVLTLIINAILDDMYLREKREILAQDSGAQVTLRPKLLGVDEAWDLMGANSGRAGGFIEEAARRIRKYRGCLFTITQNYADYGLSESAKAALTNSAWRVSLAQGSGSVDAAKRMGAFGTGSDYQWRMLESLRRGNGYSELNIVNSGMGDTFRFITDPFSYYTFTTNPDDKNRISALMAGGMTQIEAFTALADEMDAKARAAMRKQ